MGKLTAVVYHSSRYSLSFPFVDTEKSESVNPTEENTASSPPEMEIDCTPFDVPFSSQAATLPTLAERESEPTCRDTPFLSTPIDIKHRRRYGHEHEQAPIVFSFTFKPTPKLQQSPPISSL